MATSGNYRNFYEHKSKKYSHIIDPKTGHAIKSNIASVTVVAELCIDADAVATALNVMSLESGKEMVEKNDNIEALWILSDNGKFNTVQSTGMDVNLLD
jgi:thiamine biosynthesis lipoprotein